MTDINLFAVFPIKDTYSLPIGDSTLDFIRGVVTTADGETVPMARKTVEDTPLRYLWIDCNKDVNITVRYLGSIQYEGRVPAEGFYFKDMVYDEVTITTTAITVSQIIGSSTIIAGIGGTGGGGGGSGDIETVESDIDGKEGQITNSLTYGRESAGVTHPLHVDSDGDLHVISTPGATLEPAVYTTASCAAGAVVEFDIAFANLAIVNQISIEQLSAGSYDYTFEIWKSATYTPGTMADHHLKVFSRDVDLQEWGELIEGDLKYRDDDAGNQLHCRISNKATGTTSTFNVTVVGIEG